MTLVLSWVFAGTYAFFSRSFSRVKATHAAWYTLVYGLMAPVTASLTLMILFLPTLASPLVADHCHGVMCVPHTLQMSIETFNGMLTVMLMVILLLCVAIVMIAQSLSGGRRLQALSDLSEGGAGGYRVVDNPAAIAWCAGLFRPQVYVSSGLVNTLSEQQMQLVLAHELAHALRRDNLRKWFLHWATIAWPRSFKQRIRQDFADYTEQVSDLAAVHICQEKKELPALIKLLDNCCSSKARQRVPEYQARLQQRIEMLERELERRAKKHTHKKKSSLIPGYIVASMCFASVVMAVHFGHPLLEWLSR